MDALWQAMYAAAKAALNPRRLSETVTAGEVSAAILSVSGRIYTGVCMDTSSSLGICAERSAIFHMVTCGESEIVRVLALLPDGSPVPPCGACRELLVQLMPESYRNVEILLDCDSGKTVTLGELTPCWPI